jgi:hypothetical protein
MNRRALNFVGLAALAAAPVSAADMPVKAPIVAAPPVTMVPGAGFFIGLGGSFDSVNFGTQAVYAVGTSDVFDKNGTLVSTGLAAGPADIYMPRRSTFAPSVQGGYFQHFADTNWLWGAKFAYSYLGSTSTVLNAQIPQAGSFTLIVSNKTIPFTGTAVIQSGQTSILNQIDFMPFVGRSFERSFIYIGAGPNLSQTITNATGVVGFADIGGKPTNVSGAPQNFYSETWIHGGAATAGVTYFLDRSWFLDVNYTYAMTRNHTSNFSSPFTRACRQLNGRISFSPFLVRRV